MKTFKEVKHVSRTKFPASLSDGGGCRFAGLVIRGAHVRRHP
jgi:hypothetical protein